MPRTKTAGRGANGNGSIRKITTRNGKQYTYWQARYTEGYDLGTGKQIQGTSDLICTTIKAPDVG